MCGISGIVTFKQESISKDSLVQEMMKVMTHRGPDESGFHSDTHAALGHNRLSIIDLSTGGQPIFNEDRSACIIFNGEIYNYKELRKRLLGKGHTFRTHTDTETILHLYEEKGRDCVQDLRGMFTFAIWDSIKQELFLARDRMGIKPLYYFFAGYQTLCFASEIKALLKTRLIGAEVNPAAVDQYISLNYTLGPETILKGNFKLMPGHVLTFSRRGHRIDKYWDFADIKETNQPLSICIEKMSNLIEESVKMRLMSEVPLGAFLSGGLDSSVTVGIMSRLTNRSVKTFTVGYADADEESELEFASVVAKHFKTEHHEFILNPQNFMDIVMKVLWHLDEPIAEFATIPLLLLSELAKKHVTVMLSGEGADEIFAGYPVYRYMQLIEKYRRIPKSMRRCCFDPIAYRMLRKIKEGKYFDWLSRPLQSRYLGNGSYFHAAMKEKLYTDDMKQSIDPDGVQNIVGNYYGAVRHKDSLSQMLYLDTKTWLVEDLLIKADKMTMASSIELRVPFLDHRLVEFAASLPSDMKIKGTVSKYIFKKYAQDFVPRKIVYRKKRGFPVPVKRWLRHELRSCAGDILLEQRTKERGLMDQHYIRKIFDDHCAGRQDYSKNLWNLLILELWMRIFVDGSTL